MTDWAHSSRCRTLCSRDGRGRDFAPPADLRFASRTVGQRRTMGQAARLWYGPYWPMVHVRSPLFAIVWPSETKVETYCTQVLHSAVVPQYVCIHQIRIECVSNPYQHSINTTPYIIRIMYMRHRAALLRSCVPASESLHK